MMITARGLGKTFPGTGKSGGPVEAVSDLSLDVAAGELVAFLGPNGAGKSTTLRLLTTLLPASSGEASVVGCDIRRDPAGVRRRIGYIGQGSSAGYTQRVRDELHSQGAFYGIGRRETRLRADELIESLDLGAIAGRQVQTLSGGQRRRVDIALGLIHRPELLFLDEPSTGLDPQSRANLWQHIVELRRRYGTTIFLTTHYLDEAAHLADRAAVVRDGKVVALGAPADLGGPDALRPVVRWESDGVTHVERTDHPTALVTSLAARLAGPDGEVPGLRVLQPSLEDVYLELIGAAPSVPSGSAPSAAAPPGFPRDAPNSAVPSAPVAEEASR